MLASEELLLAHARERRTEDVLREAEALECSLSGAELGPSSLLLRVLVTAYLVHNDVVNATLALRRWAAVGVDEHEESERVALECVARHCGRYAYGEAFRAALRGCCSGRIGGSAVGAADVVGCLTNCLLDCLAARHLHQRRNFHGDAVGVDGHAASLGVAPEELETRLQRVREDELRRMRSEVGRGSSEKRCDMLRCIMQVGKTI
ncbi:uncharacterized protein TM35_000231370 [Trypanosoma theileri]|uniref:Uncharacterized protein n=1 Tax=Trypanosoma theileri TaxID=67003 RepID=A0A1X0NR29_9TRYP|nr:uncharacterized protein TM35_000231370 [Trypanosoma theileri]ORC87166.1 hypothetical protein TM35_000231370 [Trypanosoma theileri]